MTPRERQGEVHMEPKVENVEHAKEKKPYETPKLTRHGSVEQVTKGGFEVSGVDTS